MLHTRMANDVIATYVVQRYWYVPKMTHPEAQANTNQADKDGQIHLEETVPLTMLDSVCFPPYKTVGNLVGCTMRSKAYNRRSRFCGKGTLG